MAAFIALSGEWIGRRASDTLAIATAIASTVITIVILRGVWLQPQVYWFGNWWPRSGGVALGICFTVDAIGAALAVLTTLLTDRRSDLFLENLRRQRKPLSAADVDLHGGYVWIQLLWRPV